MGQALRKLGSARSSRIAPSKAPHAPAESRFEDPRLKGHLTGDVNPDRPVTPDPSVIPDQDREWDRSDPVYSTMVKKLAANVVTKKVHEVSDQEQTYARRPLPKIRNTRSTSFDEESAVPPGKLNLGQIREVFRSYQGLILGEKPMSVEELAGKYKVDVVLLKKVLQLHAIPDKHEDFKSAKSE
ncbi:hypothetical protein KP509_04G079800 [Ceratopteris richardii]|uniref:Uncharacterized protein n=1 Tax=Ceratopteris richardii TaxID=49495 RepID=A0A8T2V0Z6_CERRI|nr:hypothetical protein KP509_04G079800 [Ceratopteris richardii]